MITSRKSDGSRSVSVSATETPNRGVTSRGSFTRINRIATNRSDSLPIPPSQPIAPEIFFGRDELVSDLVSLVVRNDQTRLSLLGAGRYQQ